MLRRFAALIVLAAVAAMGSAPPGHSTAGAPIDPALPFLRTLAAVASDGLPPAATLSTTAVYQGGAFLVTVSEGTTGTATLLGRTYALQPEGFGLAGFVGIGTGDPPGPATVTIDYVTASGEPLRMARPITVLRTQWTVDYITIPPAPPPDPNAPPPPPPPPDETALLPVIYSSVTARKWTEQWVAPVPGAIVPAIISSYFGEQRSFNGGPVEGHHGGTDFAVDAGTPIYATNSGVVVLSGKYLVRGNLVVIDHGGGVFSAYGHMEQRLVSEGDVVVKGQLIGLVGTTGLSTGPHLHWEMAVGGVLVDGLRWLDFTQGF